MTSEEPRLNYCHLCGETEIDCDLDACFTCNQMCCPECGFEIETEDGDPLGIICGECQKLSEQP